ncbi:MAG: hypothetical protein HY846_03015 [Nitrosomonadales bacterium]|nr:hypothetical protein [Nitrosomonadales bacterium]
MTNLIILIAALIVISAGLYLKKRGGDTRWARVGDFILMALGAVALLSYVNFKPLSTQPNNWDLFHYYVGSKYFSEIGYTRLYACVARAEAESDDEAVSHAAKRRTIRDLETNELVASRNYFFSENYCKERFSAARWESFKNDIGFFRDRLQDLWELAQIDHGFNPSPVWILAGGLASGAVTLSDNAITGLVLLDVILLLGSVALIAWAFGLPVAAFAAIASTASGGIDWAWAGGGMLRLDWFFMAVLSVCAMKREHYVLAGAALGYAAALRVFPAIFALGPFIGLLYAMIKRQREQKIAYGKFFAGMAISAVVLLVSVSALYGTDSLRAFADNTRKHSAVVSTNNVGLRTVLTYRPDTAVRNSIDVQAREAHLYWKWEEAKAEAKKKVVPAYIAVVVVCLPLFVLAVISGGAWQALALGATFIPFAWSEMSNYYYLFLMIVATLFAANRKVAFPLLGVGIATGAGKLFEIDVNRYFEQPASQGAISGLGMDEVYTLFSAAVCIGFPVLWWLVKSRPVFGKRAPSPAGGGGDGPA